MSRRRTAMSIFKEINGIAKITTGKNLMELGSLIFGMTRQPAPYDPNDPHAILGIQKGASERLVKAAYRAAAFDCHPDTGLHPDTEKFRKATEAYESLIKEFPPKSV